MSSSVEDEVVRMSFDNKQFESGVATSIGSLDKLKSSLAFKNAGNGLADVTKSANGMNLGPMSSAIDGISAKWLAMGTVAVTAIANITNKVVDAGLRIGKSIAIDPLTQGFAEYSTNLNSIQTIIANTGAKLPEVNGVLKQLNTYSDKTIYNFGQMAQNIGRFTAAGVKMGPAVDAIKGMANTAALSGATSEQLNSAMYQMSQALSTGVIRLMDWNSLANANMGGQNIQKALQATAETGEDAGAAMKGAIADAGSFRDSLQEGWLTGDIFTKTMKVMAGEVNKATGEYQAFSIAQLKGMGYSEEAAKELNRLSQASIDSATKVKTISQAYDVVKESIGSGWAAVFQNIFGNFNQSKKLWTDVTKFITTGVSSFFGKINKVLFKWNKLGGRLAIIDGLKQAFKDLLRFFIPIKNAFREIFPAKTAKDLVGMSESFRDFFDLFRLNVKSMAEIRDVFTGVFTIFKVAFSIIGDVAKAFGTLFGIVGGKGGGSLLKFLGTIGRAVTAFGEWYLEGDRLGDMLQTVAGSVRSFFAALASLLPILQKVGDGIANMAKQGYEIAGNLISGMLEGLNASNLQAALIEFANNIITWIKDALGIHSPSTEMVPVGENISEGLAEGVTSGFDSVMKAFGDAFAKLGAYLKQAMGNLSFGDLLKGAQTGLLAGFVFIIFKFFKDIGGIAKSASGFMDNFNGIFGQLKSNLKTMQNGIRAEIIRNIAVSVGILAVSALLLSTVDGNKLAISLAAISGMFVGLLKAMGVVGQGTKGMNTKTMAKQIAMMISLSAAMVVFSTAILIMVAAVALMGQMDMKTIEKGLAGITGVIAIIVTATAILSKTGGGATILATAAAMLLMSVALITLAGALKLYSIMDWTTLVQGGGAAAAVIVGLGLALKVFGKGSLSGSTALIIASTALLILAGSLKMLAGIGVGDMIKSIATLVVVLATLAAAASAMTGTAAGAGAMLVMAGAIIVLAIALKILSKISVGNLLKSMLAIVLAFTIIGAAAVILAPIIPIIALLGGAILIMGTAMLLAGVGMLAFAAAMSILAVVGPAAFTALFNGVMLFLPIIPEIVAKLLLLSVGLLAFGASSLIAAPMIVILSVAIVILSGAILVISAALIVASASIAIFAGALGILAHTGGGFIDTIKSAFDKLLGVKDILINIKDAIVKWKDDLIAKFGELVAKVGEKISEFKQKIKDKLSDFTDILDKAKAIGDAIIQGIGDGIDAGWDWLKDKVSGLAGDLLNAAKEKLHINSPSKVFSNVIGRGIPEGIAHGIDKHSSTAIKSSQDLANNSLKAMAYAFRNSKDTANGLMDIRPKITPVLDLAQLTKDAAQISGKLGHHSIRADVSRNRGNDISIRELNRRSDDDAASGRGDTYNFKTEIKSKDPIDHVKVYRGQKAQIALFREVTGK